MRPFSPAQGCAPDTSQLVVVKTVRISVLVTAFSIPTPSASSLSRLAQIIDLADRHGLRVQLSLFDWLSDFSAIDASRHWADAVVGPYRDDARIALIDVHNEIDTTIPAQLEWATGVRRGCA